MYREMGHRVKARIWRPLADLPFDSGLGLPRPARAVRDGDAAGRSGDEQRGGARDRQRRDEARDCQGARAKTGR